MIWILVIEDCPSHQPEKVTFKDLSSQLILGALMFDMRIWLLRRLGVVEEKK